MSDVAASHASAPARTGQAANKSETRRPPLAVSQTGRDGRVQTALRFAKRPAAFTLIEVLAALLLVAIVVPVVMQGVSLATGAASSAKRRTEAASLAQSKLAELLATERWRGGILSGQFGNADGHNAGDYGWRAEVTPWTEPYVKELAVHVSWNRASREQSVTLTTLVYEGRPEDEEDDEEPAQDDAATGRTGGAP